MLDLSKYYTNIISVLIYINDIISYVDNVSDKGNLFLNKKKWEKYQKK